MLKQMKKTVVVAAILAIGVSLVNPKPSEAGGALAAAGFGIAEKYFGYEGPDNDVSTFQKVATYAILGTCLIGGWFLPVVWPCLLGEEGSSELMLTSDYFAENGYTVDEEATIRNDHLRFIEVVKTRDDALRSVQHRDDLAIEMQRVLPDVSDLYVQFMANSLGLK